LLMAAVQEEKSLIFFIKRAEEWEGRCVQLFQGSGKPPLLSGQEVLQAAGGIPALLKGREDLEKRISGMHPDELSS
jgi:hypothetical protein